MIWLLFVAAYLIGWFPAAVKATRILNQKPYCHGHHGWSKERDCRHFDGPNCWRISDTLQLEAVAGGCGLGFLWPLLLPAMGVYLAARPSAKRLMTDKELAALEKAAGL